MQHNTMQCNTLQYTTIQYTTTARYFTTTKYNGNIVSISNIYILRDDPTATPSFKLAIIESVLEENTHLLNCKLCLETESSSSKSPSDIEGSKEV